MGLGEVLPGTSQVTTRAPPWALNGGGEVCCRGQRWALAPPLAGLAHWEGSACAQCELHQGLPPRAREPGCASQGHLWSWPSLGCHPGHQLSHSDVSRNTRRPGARTASSSSRAQSPSVALITVSNTGKLNTLVRNAKTMVSKGTGALCWLSHHSGSPLQEANTESALFTPPGAHRSGTAAEA